MFLPPSAKIKPVRGKALTKRQREQMFRPYALEIGKLALQWNLLQDYLALIFGVTFPSRSDGRNSALLSYRIWHALRSDRDQREILKAATLVAFDDEDFKAKHPKALEDTIWLLDRTQSLADRRNDALHSPFIMSFSDQAGYTVTPHSFLGHSRAKKFEGKNALAEIKWYSATARTLSDFAYLLFYAMQFGEMMERAGHAPYPWPERPKLPQLDQSKTHKAPRYRARAKSPRPRPEASGA
jgi:hypothetical protein